MTYSGQFFDVVRWAGARAYVVSYCNKPAEVRDETITISQRPKPFAGQSGLLYHLAEIFYGLQMVAAAVRFCADFAIVTEGTTHWFVLLLMPLFGIKVIPAIHCVLWPKHKQPSRTGRWLNHFNRLLFRTAAFAVMSASDDISAQVRKVAGSRPRPLLEFLPTYRHKIFAAIQTPPETDQSFRVLFAGRIERDKGVFDLLAIARRFQSEGRHRIKFDICGTGSALDALQAEVDAAKLNDVIVCHGYCNRLEMQAQLQKAHVIIVPTRTDFIEGFNQVVVEAVLAGRPVVTSSVCPALSYVREAVVEVAPEDVTAYGDAILRLFHNQELYDRKRNACLKYQSQFYDGRRGWATALKQIIKAALEQREPVTTTLIGQIDK